MTNTPGSSSADIFISHAQRYPKSMAMAAGVAQALHTVMKKGPRTLIATVVSTAFHMTQGYVTATTENGVIQVYGVPMGTVVPQMRIMVRQQGGQATNRAYIFDAYAPVLASLASTGSLLYTSPTPTTGGQVLATSTATVASATGMSSSTGYYWHCFIYLPQLPTSVATILTMWTSSVGTALSLEQLPDGRLRFRSINDGHGYVTTGPVAPHKIHWLQLQPGLAGLEFLVDGVASYTGLLSGSDEPTFAGNAANYTLLTLTDPSGNAPCPLGTWISRIGFGMSYSSPNVVALSTGLTVPASDSQVPSFNTSATQKTSALYLCTDTPGTQSAANSAPGSSASALTLTGPYCTVNILGPY